MKRDRAKDLPWRSALAWRSLWLVPLDWRGLDWASGMMPWGVGAGISYWMNPLYFEWLRQTGQGMPMAPPWAGAVYTQHEKRAMAPRAARTAPAKAPIHPRAPTWLKAKAPQPTAPGQPGPGPAPVDLRGPAVPRPPKAPPATRDRTPPREPQTQTPVVAPKGRPASPQPTSPDPAAPPATPQEQAAQERLKRAQERMRESLRAQGITPPPTRPKPEQTPPPAQAQAQTAAPLPPPREDWPAPWPGPKRPRNPLRSSLSEGLHNQARLVSPVGSSGFSGRETQFVHPGLAMQAADQPTIGRVRNPDAAPVPGGASPSSPGSFHQVTRPVGWRTPTGVAERTIPVIAHEIRARDPSQPTLPRRSTPRPPKAPPAPQARTQAPRTRPTPPRPGPRPERPEPPVQSPQDLQAPRPPAATEGPGPQAQTPRPTAPAEPAARPGAPVTSGPAGPPIQRKAGTAPSAPSRQPTPSPGPQARPQAGSARVAAPASPPKDLAQSFMERVDWSGTAPGSPSFRAPGTPTPLGTPATRGTAPTVSRLERRVVRPPGVRGPFRDRLDWDAPASVAPQRVDAPYLMDAGAGQPRQPFPGLVGPTQQDHIRHRDPTPQAPELRLPPTAAPPPATTKGQPPPPRLRPRTPATAPSAPTSTTGPAAPPQPSGTPPAVRQAPQPPEPTQRPPAQPTGPTQTGPTQTGAARTGPVQTPTAQRPDTPAPSQAPTPASPAPPAQAPIPPAAPGQGPVEPAQQGRLRAPRQAPGPGPAPQGLTRPASPAPSLRRSFATRLDWQAAGLQTPARFAAGDAVRAPALALNRADYVQQRSAPPPQEPGAPHPVDAPQARPTARPSSPTQVRPSTRPGPRSAAGRPASEPPAQAPSAGPSQPTPTTPTPAQAPEARSPSRPAASRPAPRAPRLAPQPAPRVGPVGTSLRAETTPDVLQAVLERAGPVTTPSTRRTVRQIARVIARGGPPLLTDLRQAFSGAIDWSRAGDVWRAPVMPADTTFVQQTPAPAGPPQPGQPPAARPARPETEPARTATSQTGPAPQTRGTTAPPRPSDTRSRPPPTRGSRPTIQRQTLTSGPPLRGTAAPAAQSLRSSFGDRIRWELGGATLGAPLHRLEQTYVKSGGPAPTTPVGAPVSRTVTPGAPPPTPGAGPRPAAVDPQTRLVRGPTSVAPSRAGGAPQRAPVPFSSPDFVRQLPTAQEAPQIQDKIGGASPLRAQRGSPTAPGQVQRAPIFRDPVTGAVTGDTEWLKQKSLPAVEKAVAEARQTRRKRASRRSRVVSGTPTTARTNTFSPGQPDFGAEEQYPWDDSAEAPAVQSSRHVPGRTVWTPPNRVRKQDRAAARETKPSPTAPPSTPPLEALLDAIESGSPEAQRLLREVRREVDRLRAMDTMRKY